MLYPCFERQRKGGGTQDCSDLRSLLNNSTHIDRGLQARHWAGQRGTKRSGSPGPGGGARSREPSTALNTVQAAPGAEAKAERGALGFSPWLPEIHLGSPTNSRMHSTHPDRRNPSLIVWPGLQWFLKLHPGLPLHQPQVIQMCCQGGKLKPNIPFQNGHGKGKEGSGTQGSATGSNLCLSIKAHTAGMQGPYCPPGQCQGSP